MAIVDQNLVKSEVAMLYLNLTEEVPIDQAIREGM